MDIVYALTITLPLNIFKDSMVLMLKFYKTLIIIFYISVKKSCKKN